MTANIICFETRRAQPRAERQESPVPAPEMTLTWQEQKRRHAQRMYEHLGRAALAASVEMEPT